MKETIDWTKKSYEPSFEAVQLCKQNLDKVDWF